MYQSSYSCVPLDAFPSVLREVIQEVSLVTGAPTNLVALLALSSLSVSMRDYDIVAPTDGQRMSSQLYCIGLGDRSCGKGRAFTKMYEAIHAFEAELDTFRRQSEHGENAVALRDVTINDATWRAVFEILDGESNSVTFIDPDAMDNLKKPVMREPGRLNKLYDSPEKDAMARKGKTLRAYRPTFGLCILVQPAIYAEHMVKHGKAELDSGFLARCLFALATPDGYRQPVAAPTPALDIIHRVQKRLMEYGLSRRLAGATERLTISFSDAAERAWPFIQASAAPNRQLVPGGAQRSGDRMTEKSWRVANVFHCVESVLPYLDQPGPLPDFGPISEETLRAATRVAAWSEAEFDKVMSLRPPKQPNAVMRRQAEDFETAVLHLRAHLARGISCVIPFRLAQELTGLSPYKFNFVVTHLKARGWVEEMNVAQRKLMFRGPFFASPFDPSVVALPQSDI